MIPGKQATWCDLGWRWVSPGAGGGGGGGRSAVEVSPAVEGSLDGSHDVLHSI